MSEHAYHYEKAKFYGKHIISTCHFPCTHSSSCQIKGSSGEAVQERQLGMGRLKIHSNGRPNVGKSKPVSSIQGEVNKI